MRKLLISCLVMLGIQCFSVQQEIPDEHPVRPLCTVQTIAPKAVLGNRCRYIDEVMVGVQSVDPMTILCARLQVMCNREEGSISLASPENRR